MIIGVEFAKKGHFNYYTFLILTVYVVAILFVILFNRTTVRASDTDVKITFAFGTFSTTIRYNDIESVSVDKLSIMPQFCIFQFGFYGYCFWNTGYILPGYSEGLYIQRRTGNPVSISLKDPSELEKVIRDRISAIQSIG